MEKQVTKKKVKIGKKNYIFSASSDIIKPQSSQLKNEFSTSLLFSFKRKFVQEIQKWLQICLQATLKSQNIKDQIKTQKINMELKKCVPNLKVGNSCDRLKVGTCFIGWLALYKLENITR